jgi:GTP-binding protein HflX
VLEVGRRRAKERVTHLEQQLRKLAKQRTQRRRKRTRDGVPTVAIVGYTNAGKSTLLNVLTSSHVLAEDKLFATLDTRSRTLRVGWAGYGDREVVLTDTVGFIRELPKDLFAAFRATFEEAADADLLLHVVDANDENRDEQMETTEGVLAELGLDAIPCIIVYNKADLLSPIEQQLLRRTQPDAVLLSSVQRESTRPLIERIAAELAARWDEAAKPPPSKAELEDEDAAESGDRDASELTTVEAMLAAAGKHGRRRH